MAILLIAEHDNQSLSDQTAKALSAAAKIGSDVDVLVAGSNAKAAADASESRTVKVQVRPVEKSEPAPQSAAQYVTGSVDARPPVPVSSPQAWTPAPRRCTRHHPKGRRCDSVPRR